VGQGALAVEARESDLETLDMLAGIDHWPTSAAVRSERAFLTAMGGGCQVPVAAYAQLDGNELHISAMAATSDGDRVFRIQLSCDAADPESGGRRIAEALMQTGAEEIVGSGAAR